MTGHLLTRTHLHAVITMLILASIYAMTGRLGTTQANLRSFLPDGVHPNTPAARAAIADDAARWARDSRFVLDPCSNRWVLHGSPAPAR